jgi:alpha-glucosidase
MDGDGDGIGDLQGVRSKLDYLSWLGIDAVWLTPVFQSPMKDFGYDISDYKDVDPVFGSLSDLDALLAEAHRLNMKVILDLVPNHTSDQHPWFLAARSSRNDPKRDWYIWHDPAPDGGPPNNWRSNLGTPAWEFDPDTGQYYYHAFLKEQPDLNWRNPEVRDAMFDVMRFWMDRGFDGFRVDVIWQLIKDAQFRDNPPAQLSEEGMMGRGAQLPTYTRDRPEVHDVISGMRAVVDEYNDRVLIGEIYLPLERLVAYYGSDAGSELHLPFNFQLLFVPWSAAEVAGLVNRYEATIPEHGWPSWVLGNHDQPRIATRLSPDQARVAAMLLLTLRGTPTLYYGDELGMTNVEIPAGATRDRFDLETPGMGRDAARTPMQWSAAKHAGFSTATPWLPVAPNAADVNVEVLSRDETSILSLHRRLLQLRRQEPALAAGDYRFVGADGAFVFARSAGGETVVVALNLTDAPKVASLPPDTRWRLLLSTHLDREDEAPSQEVPLRANEGVILRQVP